ncbi:hypothetical protein SAY87_024339 [Trapa incisa]|uniref:Uncharacterized protein n=1 Tax=Trapa incisa TaxID=236973 RepID=A0AAN7J8L5_9MYRT|nr:hypothetical protein SAY87_024339 [Trapa incisa]
MSMTVVVGILGGISSQGRILLDAGASVRTELHLAQEPAALAAGMVAVFALLAWITSTMRSGALTWKVGRFRVVPGFISWHLQIGLPSISSAFERVIGFFKITSSMKSAESSVVVVGSKPATCDNICCGYPFEYTFQC